MKKFLISMIVMFACLGAVLSVALILRQDTNHNKETELNQTEIATLLENLNKKEDALTALTNSLEAEQAKVNALKVSVENDTATIKTLQNSITKKESEIVVLNSQIDNLSSDITVKQGQIDNLNSTITLNNQKIANLESDIAEKQNQINELNNSITINNQTITNLHAEITTKQNEIDNLDLTIEANNVLIVELQADIDVYVNQIQELNNEISVKNQTISDLNVTVEEKQIQIVNLQAEVQEKEETINNLQQQISNNNAVISSYQEEIVAKTSQIRTLESDLETVTAERDSLNITINEKNVLILDLELNISVIEEEKEELLARIEELEEALNYDESALKISDLYDKASLYGAELSQLKISDNKFLIYTSSDHLICSGVYLYNSLNSEVIKLCDNGYYYTDVFKFNNGDLYFYCPYKSHIQACYFNLVTETVKNTQQYSGYNPVSELQDGSFLVKNNYNFYILNRETLNVDISLGTLSACGGGVNLPNGDFLFTFLNSSNKYIKILNLDSMTIEEISTTDYFSYAGVISVNEVLLSGETSLYTFNIETKELNLLHENIRPLEFFRLNESYVFLGAYNKSWLLDLSDYSITVLQESVGYGLYGGFATLDNGDFLFSQSNKGIYVLKMETKEMIKLSSNGFTSMVNKGAYLELYINQLEYYILGSDSTTQQKPVLVDFVTITKDADGNIIEDVGGSVAINPQALTSYGSTSSVEILSESNTGYYLSGIYSDEACTNLIVSTLEGETTIKYSSVYKLIDSETNTITLYALYEEVDENTNPGQTDKGEIEGPSEDLEPGF